MASTVKADFHERPRWLVEGFEPMCARIPAECAPYGADDRRVVTLTAKTARRLDQVNREVNNTITYMTDLEQYSVPDFFTYPKSGSGDCEDYALEKRRRLVARGFPRRAMLLTIVDTPGKESPELHMILILRTDHGDLALDINHPDIRPLNGSEYSIKWTQSPDNPRIFDPGPGLEKALPK